jgi:hypothetical protein
MLLNGKHARRVIQFLADVFADTLRLAAAGALSAFRLMTDYGTWELRRQRSTLGLLTGFVRCRGGTKCFQLGVDGFEVGVEQVIQQAALRRAYLLAALGKLVAFEDRDFVRELLDDVSSRWIFRPMVSTFDSNCAARARSCSGVMWSRLSEEVMPWILPKQPTCHS